VRRTRPPAGSGALVVPGGFRVRCGGTTVATAWAACTRIPKPPTFGRAARTSRANHGRAPMDDDSLLDDLQEDLGPDYSPHLRVAAGMLSGDAQAAVPYLLFSIAKSLEDISFLLSNDSVSVVMETDEEE
jgi:hypothetical protein